ncbi:hypothetical protein CPB83DRAFT_852305, partial [Crepidotus variabilis]
NPFSDSVPISELSDVELFLPSQDVWFLVEGKLLTFDISRLCLVSPILSDARAAASINGVMSEGTRDNPLRMPETISYPVFRDFIFWFFRYHHKDDTKWTTGELQNIMEMAHFWQVESGQDFAADLLSARGELLPCFRMWLARKYDIASWIPSIVADLIRMPLTKFTGADIMECSNDVWAIIAKARSDYKGDLILLATSSVCRCLLSPDNPLTPSELLAHLHTLSYPKMQRDCRKDMLEYLKCNPEMFTLEQRIEAGAIAGVCRVLGFPAS